jgi:hypothetical protein
MNATITTAPASATSDLTCDCTPTPETHSKWNIREDKLCTDPLFMTAVICLFVEVLVCCLCATYSHSRQRLLHKIRSQPRERRNSYLKKVCKKYEVFPDIDPRDIAWIFGGRRG